MPSDQTTTFRAGSPRRVAPRVALAMATVLVTLLAGCDSLFEVENPNNIQGEDLELPQAQSALVNGSFGTVARGLAASLGMYSPATDEVTFIGSRDSWRQLDFGFVDDPQNEFVNVAFPVIAQGRWMADEAIKNLEMFRDNGTLRSEDDLARAYLYGAMAYTNIADTFDDFVFSDRGVPSPPVGEGEMGGLYDTAAGYLTSGLEIVQRSGNRDLQLTLLAMRSRVRHAQAIWRLLNPGGSTPANPLVSSPQAAEDARAFFALNPGEDWEYVITLGTNDMIPGGEITLGHNMNNRAELQFGVGYVSVAPNDPAQVTGITLMDPIDDVPDPFVTRKIEEFEDAFIYTSETIVSARELRLILAENALASGNVAEAVDQINRIRALDGLTPYSPAQHALTPTEMLEYHRRSSLFLQNKRLADMYRFGVEAPEWTSSSAAATRPGTFFPIANVEQQANCFIIGTC